MLPGMLLKGVYSLGDDGDKDIYVPHIRFSLLLSSISINIILLIRVYVETASYICNILLQLK